MDQEHPNFSRPSSSLQGIPRAVPRYIRYTTLGLRRLDAKLPKSSKPPKSPGPTILYFAYGSNLSLAQMHERCPTSSPLVPARLAGYRWIISTRGYANIVASRCDEVWGFLYSLTPTDEASLDKHEGVPTQYIKQTVTVEIPLADSNFMDKQALVYIDLLHKTDGTPMQEYIGRMKAGIHDAVCKGAPVSYFKKSVLPPLGLSEEVLPSRYSC
ncbi:hypothetical protein TWF696_008459 [Orbilia brochopaga]|uniref:gamma-glutamylcyclotransferase n=1 Tax=Orbilia brochopaga TaxID=3140254 RepID=A0AAV9UI11_9PEZI